MLATLLGRFKPIENKGIIVALVASAALLFVRIWLAIPFWKSGQTKWVEFPTQLSSSAKYLFNNEYKFHLGFGTFDMPFPNLMALGSGLGEIILPVMLVLGFISRGAALGLLGMTLVIQFVYPGGWMIHLTWAIAALVVLIAGPGMFSIDEGIRRLISRR